MDDEKKRVFTDLPAGKADLILLILASQNIETSSERQGSRFDIHVENSDAQKALSAVESYYRENRFFRLKKEFEDFSASSFRSVPAIVIVILLAGIHLLIRYFGIHEKMVLQFGASALYISQGETYRAVTALFLHADAGHLLGNLAGMIVFAAPMINLSGYGTGPFMLLFTGTFGNILNAHFYQTAHLSIGASTSVMGAAGLLAAYQMTAGRKASRFNALMPLLAAGVLVAMLSQGERTDVMAHVFGFLTGLGSGMIFFPLNSFIRTSLKEKIALCITLTVLLSAFAAPFF